MTDDREEFTTEVRATAARMGQDVELRELSMRWIDATAEYRYSYNFEWMGLPIIQFPQDIIALQELVWNVKPDLIIETGVARGGSVVFYASMLELLGGSGRVLGIDIDIRPHNREALETHPMSKRIDLLEGSSIDPSVVEQASLAAAEASCVMIVLDSNHTHEHVLEELRQYAPLATDGSYVVVLDTVIEDMSDDAFPDRPWGKGANPKTAVAQYLDEDPRFEVDRTVDDRLLLSVAPGGYLRCKGPRPSDGK